MGIPLLLLATLLPLVPARVLEGGAACPAEEPGAAFTLKIAPSPSVAKPGSAVVVKIGLTNISEHAIDVGYTYAYRGDFYRVDIRDTHGRTPPQARPRTWLDSNGRRVTRTLGGVGAGVRSVKPGETMLDEYLVNDHYDLTQPGKYTVQASRLDDETKTWVKSNTITLTVTPP